MIMTDSANSRGHVFIPKELCATRVFIALIWIHMSRDGPVIAFRGVGVGRLIVLELRVLRLNLFVLRGIS